ncbi:MAG: tRNA pseudouridine(13) synthase TruD [Planctomycetota bacterium]
MIDDELKLEAGSKDEADDAEDEADGTEEAALPIGTERYTLKHARPDPVVFPRLAADIPACGGTIRTRLEDFEVEEMALYNFSGHGEHCYVTVRKTNRTTLQARDFLARELNVRREEIGFAGFKDKRAIATQTFSIAGVKREDVERISAPWLEVLQVTYHGNKLRTGHLLGNHFKITIRGVRPGALADARRVIDRLRATGMPNFYGPQRFGAFSHGYLIGHALLHRNVKEAIDQILSPRQQTDEKVWHYYQAGDYATALEELPPGRVCEAAVLHALRRYPGNFRAAVRKIPPQLRRMYYSAYQSFLFNWAIHERREWSEDALSCPVAGDIAYLHRNGASFAVEAGEEDVMRERAARGEISPTGPIFGRKMKFARGRPGALEWAILAAEHLRPQSFLSHVKGLHLDGTRRPLRVLLKEVDIREADDGTSLVLAFELPPGSYATTLLEQIMGPGRVEARGDGADDVDERAEASAVEE